MAIYTKEGNLISGNMQDHLQEAYKHRAGNLLIEKRIAAAVAAEREACAQIAEDICAYARKNDGREKYDGQAGSQGAQDAAQDIANLIRARGK